MVTRRTLLLGGLGTAALAISGTGFAIEADVVPGRIRLAQLTGHCDVDAPGRPTDANASVVTSGSFPSSARRRTVGWSIATPPGVGHGRASGRPGAAWSRRGSLRCVQPACDCRTFWLHTFSAVAARSRSHRLTVAIATGTRAATATTRSRCSTTSTLPLLADQGTAHRIALRRWAGRWAASAPCCSPAKATAATLPRRSSQPRPRSPALFASFRRSAAGSFDDADDFAAFGDLTTMPDVGSTALYVACGDDDAFTAQTKRYRAKVSPTPAGDIGRGCHTAGYWRSIAAEQISFVAAHLG